MTGVDNGLDVEYEGKESAKGRLCFWHEQLEAWSSCLNRED